MFMVFETAEEQNLFDKIYNEYDDMLTKYAVSLMNNINDGEEILQEAYYRIVKGFSNVEKVDEALRVNYLMTIVRNCANDFYNKRKNDVCADYLEDLPEADFTDNTAGTYDTASEHIKDIIAGLDSKYADVITLKYTYGYKISEIAEMLGISEANVSTRLNRAKKKIREEYERGE